MTLVAVVVLDAARTWWRVLVRGLPGPTVPGVVAGGSGAGPGSDPQAQPPSFCC
jgi:hypothetical protein